MKIPAFVFAVIVLLMTSYFTYAVADSHRTQKRAHEVFQPIPARMLESEIGSMGSGSSQRSFQPRVEYEYQVAGRRYVSDKFFYLGYGSNDYDEVKTLLKDYPVGSMVTAYYDPSAPEIAVLDSSPPEGTLFLAAGLGLFWLTGLGVLVYSLWPR